MTGNILLTAYLDSPMAGEPPQLDAMLEWALCPFDANFQAGQSAGLPHCRIDRKLPAPPQATIAIPLMRIGVGRWRVSQCSNPILPKPDAESVEHINKRLAVEHAGLLAEDQRRVVSATNSWTKSYRLPLRVRRVSCVRWFCVSNERKLRKALRNVRALGKKVADGYGRVREWATEPAPGDFSFFAPVEGGTVLMRTLPASIDGRPWLPEDLLGHRRHFGACVPPYWHPERFTEVVVPC